MSLSFALLEEEPSEIEAMSVLATSILREYYDPIIGKEQNDYMLRRYQSREGISHYLQEGYLYYFVKEGEASIGFLSIIPKENLLYLDKFYLAKEARGKGYGKEMVSFLCKRCLDFGLPRIELNVNKHNPSIAIYEKLGFHRDREECNDIGGGFYKDDYVFALDVNPAK